MKDKVKRKVRRKNKNNNNMVTLTLIILLICFIIIFIYNVINSNDSKNVEIYNKEVEVYSKEVEIYNKENISIEVNSNIKNNNIVEETEQKDNKKLNNNEKVNNNKKVNNNEKVNNNVKASNNNVKPKAESKPTYIKGILIANKTYKLPSTYNPGLQKVAKEAFDKMKNDAKEEGITLWILSGFRSYKTQENLYNRYVRTYGKKASDTFSARPGHSEHQTGLAMDINSLEDNFGNTKEGKWLSKNAHKYGFILRYPKGKEEITGYKYEPWHFRYLGVDVATDVFNNGLTLEEYLGITSKYQE